MTPGEGERLRQALERAADRIASARVIAKAIVDNRQKDRPMTSKIAATPLVLNRVVSTLNESAAKAMARLERAASDHDETMGKVHGVAEVIEKSTAQTNELIASMIGDNGAPADDKQEG